MILTPPYYTAAQDTSGITRVQSAKGNTGSSTANSATITVSALTAGNFLIVGTSQASNAVTAVAAPGSGTDQDFIGGLVARAYDSTGTVQNAILLYKIITGGATSVVVKSVNAANFQLAAVVVEYSATNLIPDQWATNNGTGTSPSTGTTAATAYNNELVIGVVANRGTFAAERTADYSSPTNSFSIVQQTSSFINTTNNDREIALLEKIITSSGTQSTGATSPNTRWSGCIASFKELKSSTTF